MSAVTEATRRLAEKAVEGFSDDETPMAAVPSVLDALRAKRAEIAQSKPRTLDLAIPAYDEPGSKLGMVVRYHYPDAGIEPLLAVARRAQDPRNKDRDIGVNGACDTLIAACQEVLGRDEHGELVPLDPSRDEDHPLRFGRPLAELFGIAIPEGVRSPARFVVRHVFSPGAQATGVYDGDAALIAHSGRVTVWLQGEDIETSEEFSGEA